MSASEYEADVNHSRKTTSTLADGNHVFPPFYACYLLRSRATPQTQRTYIGSTPNPLRRIRQHNGELTQGAWKTSRFRPWEVQMIVYGFPSKLTALQFEWAWQNPERSRHLRVRDGAHIDSVPMFSKNARANRLETKAIVAGALLRSPPFINFPLHIQCFTETTHDLSMQAIGHPRAGTQLPDKANSRLLEQVGRLPKPSHLAKVDLDIGGLVSALSGEAQTDTQVRDLNITDGNFRCGETVVGKWNMLQEHPNNIRCASCSQDLDIEDHLSFAICPADNAGEASCVRTTHLTCLAKESLSEGTVLPRWSACRGCGATAEWGRIIRACYGRRDYMRRQT